jgi:hypothetical protein
VLAGVGGGGSKDGVVLIFTTFESPSESFLNFSSDNVFYASICQERNAKGKNFKTEVDDL